MALTKASLIDVNGQELILDADADTSITADTDDQIDIKIAGSDSYVITGGGDPIFKMQGSGHPQLRLKTTGTTDNTSVDFGDSDSETRGRVLYNHNDDRLSFTVAAAERIRITDSNVFLNQTATADSGVADGRLEITRGNQHCINCHVGGSGNSTLIAFINDNGFVGGINTNGSNTVYNTSSDARLKNVLGEAKGLEVINALNPVNFEWKKDNKIQDGLIAQEVEKIFPEAVSKPELEGEWYSVDYSKLVTPLIKGMQEQQKQIEELKKEIETLKN